MLVPDTASVVVQVLHGGYPRFGVAFAPRSGSVSDSKKVIARLLSARLADRGCQRRFSGSICFSRLTDEILNELLHHVSPMSRFQKPPGIVRCKRLIPRHRNRPILSFQKQVLLGGDGRTGSSSRYVAQRPGSQVPDGVAPVVPLSAHQGLHVKGGHVLKQPVPQSGEDFIVQKMPDGFRVLPVAQHSFSVVLFGKFFDSQVEQEAGSRQLLLRGWRSPAYHQGCPFVPLLSRHFRDLSEYRPGATFSRALLSLWRKAQNLTPQVSHQARDRPQFAVE